MRPVVSDVEIMPSKVDFFAETAPLFFFAPSLTVSNDRQFFAYDCEWPKLLFAHNTLTKNNLN